MHRTIPNLRNVRAGGGCNTSGKPSVLILFLALCIVASVSSCKKSNPAFRSLERLEGTWVMRFEGSAVYEQWKRENDTLYSGMSFEVSNGDSVMTETLQIISNDEGIFYIPTVSDQNDGLPVAFKLAEQEGDVFVFENPGHDFPTNITYEFLPGNKLKATVSGMVNEQMRSLEFDYVKLK